MTKVRGPCGETLESGVCIVLFWNPNEMRHGETTIDVDDNLK
jgi:hypothetical protein